MGKRKYEKKYSFSYPQTSVLSMVSYFFFKPGFKRKPKDTDTEPLKVLSPAAYKDKQNLVFVSLLIQERLRKFRLWKSSN